MREKSQLVSNEEPKIENDDAIDSYTEGGDVEEGADGQGQRVMSGRSRKHVSGPSNLTLSDV